MFDIYVGNKEHGRFLDYDQMTRAIEGVFEPVPLLHRGPFSRDLLEQYTAGPSTLGGNNREGIVIHPAVERGHPLIDRVIVKSLSEKHLLRRQGTEYN